MMLRKIWLQYRLNPKKNTLISLEKGIATIRTYPNKRFIRNHNIVVTSISFVASLLIFVYISPILAIIPIFFGAIQNIYGTGSSLTWTNPGRAGGAPDGDRASQNSSVDASTLQVSTFGDKAGLGKFLSARHAINLRDDGASGATDELLFQEELPATGAVTLRTFTTATDGDYTEDTNLFFSAVNMDSWGDLELLILNAVTNTVGADAFTWEVDSMFTEITFSIRQRAYNFGFTTIASLFGIVLKGIKTIKSKRR